MNVRDINTAPSRQAQATCKKRRSRGAAVYASGPLEAGDRLLCFGKLEEMRSMIPERRRRRAKVRKLPPEALPTE